MKNESLKRAWAEINLDRLVRNTEKCRSLIPADSEIMCAVKANCYGHGCEGVIPCLENEAGVDWFAVSNVVEGIELRDLGVAGEILILGYTPPKNAAELAEYDLIQTITDADYAEALSKNCPIGQKIRCHIAIDTGMSRIGLTGGMDKICSDAEAISRNLRLEVEGIFTHLAAADSYEQSDISFTNRQIETVCAVKEELKKRFVLTGRLHFLNSAGAVTHPDPRSELVRFGIMIYGLKPDIGLKLPFELEPVMELKSVVSQVKTVRAGESISYGRTFTADHDMKVATVTIGYADGVPRLLSNVGETLIHGKRAKIVGRVCMDQLMADVSDIDGVKPEDVVTLIGSDGDETITADEVGALCNTVGYEIVCGISPRVPRIFM